MSFPIVVKTYHDDGYFNVRNAIYDLLNAYASLRLNSLTLNTAGKRKVLQLSV